MNDIPELLVRARYALEIVDRENGDEFGDALSRLLESISHSLESIPMEEREKLVVEIEEYSSRRE